ncbi:MAG: 6-phosphogluconate dehydrogenase (Decarboxylating) [candidate division TM6 bacterium GW2011_GWA2_36_9]|nr:MAG: 6-phosphogluconate dehydrogenase (Decarboxylating) [candidate division TM6 bacterium GW2011_GWA2_36_9]
MKIGIIGLGKMGSAIATRLAQGDHDVIGYDPHVKITINRVKQVDALQAITQQEIIWLMVPAEAIDKILQELTPHLIEKNILKGCARPDASSTLSTKGCARPDASSTLSTKGCARPELVEGYEWWHSWIKRWFLFNDRWQ